MNNSISGFVVNLLTGVVRPVEEVPLLNSSQEIALSSGWIILIAGIVTIIAMIIYQKFRKSRSEEYEAEENVKSVKHSLVNSLRKDYTRIKKVLVKKGLSEYKVQKCIDYIIYSS